MTNLQVIRRVLLPQAWPISLPMFSNLLISLVKASALASMVSVVDVLRQLKSRPSKIIGFRSVCGCCDHLLAD